MIGASLIVRRGRWVSYCVGMMQRIGRQTPSPSHLRRRIGDARQYCRSRATLGIDVASNIYGPGTQLPIRTSSCQN